MYRGPREKYLDAMPSKNLSQKLNCPCVEHVDKFQCRAKLSGTLLYSAINIIYLPGANSNTKMPIRVLYSIRITKSSNRLIKQ